MADYAISNVPRRVVYAPSGVGPYAFTFEILNQTDIAVYKASTLLTLTTDYTVTINANGTGSVTLVVTAGTSNITIVGSKNIQRTTDFTTGGDLFANTLNDELDNQTIFIQQVAETAERGLKAPVTDPTDIAMTLPAKDGRKGKVLAFDSTTGNPVAGPALDSVTTVIAQSANINTVADNIADVIIVADDIADVNTVAGVAGNVTTVATNIANVNAVGADLLEATSEINTVAVDIANVNTVGTNIASVNTVAGISANVTTVAGISANVTTVSGIAANVTTVAGVSANVTTVAGISANVTTVAGINAAVSTVATNNANVSTVATNIASVNTNATNIVAIQNASTNATNAATSATAAQTAQSAAESARDATLAAYDNFDDRYLGSKTSNPTLDNDGNALAAGALYFNSVSGAMQVYTGSAWVAAYVSGTGFLASANNLSDVASTSSARTNLGLGTGDSPNFTGVVTGAGTVSAPSITTTGDTNTGIFFPSADTIAFTEGGVESMRIDSSGNVGIGSTNPTRKLQISQSIATTYAGDFDDAPSQLYIANTNTTTNAYTGLQMDVGGNSQAGISAVRVGDGEVAMTFGTRVAGTRAERMRINSAGDVNVGLTNGTSKVTIFNSPGYGHFNSGNSAENGSYPLVGAFDNPAVASATYGWGFYDSNATGNLSIYRRNGSTTGIKTCEWNRSNGNFSFDSGYGSAATAYGCRAWVNFNGTGTVAIRASGNVSSITDGGTGIYTVNFTTSMPDTDYAVLGTCERDGGNSDNPLLSHRTRATGSVVINTARANVDLFDMIAPTVAIIR